ncbi:lysophospholipid acyltransferase family protein [Magnetovibrio sp.]|uniref:lysophospholipid acyltransferase family protein n=1 Tax=Magnetovibrio sp. TaxID=2024836 RepID=UPI002F932D7D
MTAIRSFLFNTVFFAGGLVLALLLLPCLVLPRRAMQWGLKFWAAVMMQALKLIAGLSWEVRGLENVPDRPCIFACKHQSAWETGIFYLLVDDPSYILKKELLSIPFFGWYLAKGGAIAIDRKAGASALKLMITGAQDRLARGQNVVIFPEGTRSAPGKPGTYHPGVAALYKGVDAPLVPVALNSGLFWQRRSFLKRPGRITIEFLPAVAPDQDRKAFMRELQTGIEGASNALIAEARAVYPHALPERETEPSEDTA